MHPVRLGARAAGPFFAAAADPGLPYRRVLHWSIRHGLGQVPGIDHRHLRTRPDLHAVHDRAGNRPEEDRARRQGHPVCRRRAIDRRLPARDIVLHRDRPVDGRRPVSTRSISASPARCRARSSSSRCCTRSASSTRCPGRITLGVLVLQDIFAILFLAVQPSLDNLQVSVILISIAPGRRAGGDRAGAQPLRAAVAVPPDRAPAGTDPARRAGLVLPDRRDRRAGCICRARWARWWPASRCRHSPMRSTSPPR